MTSARLRDYSLPETVLVKAVVERLLALVVDLRQAGALSDVGWGSPYAAWEPALRRLLESSGLRHVEREPIRGLHLEAARAARHPCYAEALHWWQDLEDGLRTKDPTRIARMVAEGAVTPAPDTRLELAVVTRLVEALEHRLCGEQGWRIELCLVEPGRDEVAVFTRPDGALIRVHYNQAVLPPGPAELGARHYLEQQGRMRPDVTVSVEVDGRLVRAHVLEVKLSDDPGYVLGGFHEAILYANEYLPHLTGWPRAVLVASSAVPGAHRELDPVIAIDWAHWVPTAVVEGMVAGVARGGP